MHFFPFFHQDTYLTGWTCCLPSLIASKRALAPRPWSSWPHRTKVMSYRLDIWLQGWPTWPVCHVIQSVNILAKLEYTNPTGSAKDRLAKYLLDGRCIMAASLRRIYAKRVYGRARKEEPVRIKRRCHEQKDLDHPYVWQSWYLACYPSRQASVPHHCHLARAYIQWPHLSAKGIRRGDPEITQRSQTRSTRECSFSGCSTCWAAAQCYCHGRGRRALKVDERWDEGSETKHALDEITWFDSLSWSGRGNPSTNKAVCGLCVCGRGIRCHVDRHCTISQKQDTRCEGLLLVAVNDTRCCGW